MSVLEKHAINKYTHPCYDALSVPRLCAVAVPATVVEKTKGGH